MTPPAGRDASPRAPGRRAPALAAAGAAAGAALLLGALVVAAIPGSLDLPLGPLSLRSRALDRPAARPGPAPPRPAPCPAAPGAGGAAAEPRVRGVVLVIGDGFGLGGIAAASTLVHGVAGGFAVESFPVVGLVRTASAIDLVTDSAAAATAMATGVRTRRGVVGQRPDGTRLRSLFEAARAAGLATGAVTTSGLMDATPAGFTAHADSRERVAEILVQQLGSGAEVLVGAHWGLLEDPQVRVALDALRSRGVAVVDSEDALAEAAGPVVALFGPRDGAPRSGGPALEVSARAALRILSADDDGFVLLVESEESDRTSHNNETERLAAAASELDAAVRVVRDFAAAHPDTLVIVTADHETGGPAVVGGTTDRPGEAEIQWLSEHHTGTWVALFAIGPGAERFAGVLDNSEIGPRLAALLGVGELNPEP
jgi:alkaline phosphatase